ncbi:hypothetical protein [Pontibacter sp. SGAir0037]|uniref:hypothetical protein n=1 Tax=Pontibacter sp. SGAir0037 TaxID=2571030 RepID=UPI00143DA43B|nr:hypothetical protein [Pontibacter sp. SGAir0037]
MAELEGDKAGGEYAPSFNKFDKILLNKNMSSLVEKSRRLLLVLVALVAESDHN